MIFVDDLMEWPQVKGRAAQHGTWWCHMTTDNETDLEELHQFAEKIGLKRSYFQKGSVAHYDLTPAKRELALKLGATYKSSKEQARERIAKRRANYDARAKAENGGN